MTTEPLTPQARHAARVAARADLPLRPEQCPACVAEHGNDGRYCAPARCYCGHDQCPTRTPDRPSPAEARAAKAWGTTPRRVT